MDNHSQLGMLPSRSGSTLRKDLHRETYGLLGLPIDAIGIDAAIGQVRAAAASDTRLFISTVNLNFFVTSSTNAEFRRAVLLSDLSVADGMPVVWLARLLGIPIRERVAGSDMFESLRRSKTKYPISVYFFGGPEGVAAQLCSQLNSETGGVRCAGWHFPGFGNLAAMSAEGVINEINASKAQFLAVALGAAKGQAWLLHNQEKLTIPVRVHLGASINFEAGALKRAPTCWRKAGIEWLWRIIQEPYLWRRYFGDAIALAKILAFSVIPLHALRFLDRLHETNTGAALKIKTQQFAQEVVIYLSGMASAPNVNSAVEHCEALLTCHKNVAINLAGIQALDARFLGFLLMLNKSLMERNLTLRLVDVPAPIKRRLKLNGFGFLLEQGQA